ncbi:MAG: DNA gyrase subunit A [Deltaproteobacteria bacterium]|jgi:DNA gyrase subunit A|nr:DNA gyrase subunit A [Deltaproteobacteria bacterium]
MTELDNINIIPVNIEDEMRGSYIDYAMSVIIGRALPDVRDGLKPVHRRILFAMLNEGLTSDKKYSKCAGVIGEVLKHLHPHGDVAVYDSLVRLAQTWNLRYPLIDGQGNFGSIDGDPPAAYRYTECRMRKIAESLLADIDKATVDWMPNFDESMDEPTVLPTRIPNLLINGTEGIAVGMASKIPPHNLSEVIAGTIKLIQNPDITLEELMECIPAPDFPTGGIIYGTQTLRSIYQTGRGTIRIRSKIHTEISKGKRESEMIIVDEIPYQVNKANLVEKIAELVNEKKIEGISKLRDESDRHGMRIVIELKRDAVTQVVLNQLFKLTLMEKTFGVIMLAIDKKQPKVLGLKAILGRFIEHRKEVIIRRTQFELNKAQARQHILEGLRIALEHIDEVIEVIKKSESTHEAKEALIKRFSLSEIQAQHILDMPLKRLTGLERQAIEKEYQELCKLIEELLGILVNAEKVNTICIEELKEIEQKYGDKRRTELEDNGEDIDLEDLIVEEDMVVTVSHKGYIKRCSPSIFKAQKRGGKGIQGAKKLDDADEDFISDMFIASTHAYLLVLTTQGKLYWIKVHQLPETSRTARGRAIVNMLKLGEDEKISAILPVRKFEEGKFVFFVTRNGTSKRVDLMAFSNVRTNGIKAINLDNSDELVGVRLTDGMQDCIVSSKFGMAIRFHEDEIRAMGRTASGVRAMRLDDGDSVVSFVMIAKNEDGQVAEDVALFTVCQNGYGKRTAVTEYREQSRGGKGVIDIKTEDRNGPVVETIRVYPNDQVMIITNNGKVIRMNISDTNMIGRNTKGVRLINLEDGETVASIARIADGGVVEEEEDEEELKK